MTRRDAAEEVGLAEPRPAHLSLRERALVSAWRFGHLTANQLRQKLGDARYLEINRAHRKEP